MNKVFSTLSFPKRENKHHIMIFANKGEQLFCSLGLNIEQHKNEIGYILNNPSGGYTEIPESYGEKNILLSISPLMIGNEKWMVAIETTANDITKNAKELKDSKQKLLIAFGLLFVGYVSKRNP